MKSTGVVRKVGLGRVVIPIELRRTLGIAEKDALEIDVDREKIILKKYEPACISAATRRTCSTIAARTSARSASRRWPRRLSSHCLKTRDGTARSYA